MDEKPDQIMNHIETQRSQLGRNLNELESRVKQSTDWRVQFDRNPMMMMGVALGGGLLLGSIVTGKKKSRRSSWSSSSSSSPYYGRSYEGSSSSSMMEPASYGSVYPTSRTTSGSTMAGAFGSGQAMGIGDMESQSTSSTSGRASSALSGIANRLKPSDTPAYREERRRASDTLDNMKAALIGFATTKLKEFMTEALPGFDRHLNEAEQRNRSQYGGDPQRGHTQEGSQTSESAQAQRPSSQPYGSGSSQYGGTQTRGQEGGTQSSTQENRQTTNIGSEPQSSASVHKNQPAGVNTGANI